MKRLLSDMENNYIPDDHFGNKDISDIPPKQK
jgi:hypothetical protein